MSKKKNREKKNPIQKKNTTTPKRIFNAPNDPSRIGLLILILLPFILYHTAFGFGYVLDDVIVYTENNYVTQGWNGIWKILSTETFEGYFGEQKNLVEGARYRPLSLMTFAVEYAFYGFKPSISHGINIFLYGLAAALLYLCFLKVIPKQSKNFWLQISFALALLFLVHPLHIEAVANIKGRDEILAFLMSFGSLYFAFKYIDSNKIIHLVIMCAIFFLGLLAKENTITFLAVIPFTIYFFRKNVMKKNLLVLSLLSILTVAYLVLRMNVIGYFLSSGKEITDIMNNPFYGMEYGQETATIFHTLGVYLKLHFFPHPLTHDYYPYHIPISNWQDIRALFPLIIHIALVSFSLAGLKKKNKYAYCIIIYFAMMSIVSNLFVSVGTFMNERFTFSASVAFCLFIPFVIHDFIVPKWGQKIGLASLGLIIFAFTIKSYQRIPVWENPITLNTAAIKVSKNSARSNTFMATALFNKYKEDRNAPNAKQLVYEAQPYANKAVEILPYYLNANLMKAGVASELYRYDRDLDKLLSIFKDVISRRPDVSHIHSYCEYLNNSNADFDTMIQFYIDISKELNKQNKLDWAIHYLKYGFTFSQSNKTILELLITNYKQIGLSNEADFYQQKLSEAGF